MSDRSRLRLAILQLLVLSLVGTLLARLWYLQVLAGDQYERIAANNGRGTIAERATRGRILDDMGRPLVTNRTSLVVSVSFNELQRLERPDRMAVLKRVGTLIKVRAVQLEAEIEPCRSWGPKREAERKKLKLTACNNGSPLQPVPVATDVPEQVAFRIMEHREDFPGVEAKAVAVRAYPYGDLAAHVFGYLGRINADEIGKGKYKTGYDPSDLVGRGGVEEVYDRDLKGVSGRQVVSVNRLGRVTGVVETREPRPGNDLVLSLDLNVQRSAERALEQWMAFARRTPDKNGIRPAPSAAAVVVDVKTGRLVALASNPTFDPARFGARIPQKEFEKLFGEKANDPLVSRAVQGLFSPGSTFKLVSTAAAVEAGRAPLNGIFNCPGALKVGNSNKSNFEGRGEGPISLYTTLVKSCDTVYYQFAMDEWYTDQSLIERDQKPREVLQRMAREFGFGKPTGVDLPDERGGLIRDRASIKKAWEENRDYFCKLQNDPSQTPYQQAIARENCQEGFRYRLGSAANDYVGQGDVLVTPLQMAMAYAALANGGTLYEPRIAKAVVGPDGKVVRQVKPKVAPAHCGRRPDRGAAHAAVHPQRPRARADRGHRARRVRRVPVRARRGRRQDRHGRGQRQARHVVVRVVRPGRGPALRRRRHGRAGRHRWHRRRARRAADLGRHLRARRAQGGVQRRAAAERVAAHRARRLDPQAGAAGPPGGLAVGRARRAARARTPQGGVRVTGTADWTTPRVSPVALNDRESSGRRRSTASRRCAGSTGSLVLCAIALSGIGALLVWSATRSRMLTAAGSDPAATSRSTCSTSCIGLALGAVAALVDYRMLRAYAPIVYVASTFGLVAVLSPLGSTINGAHSWIVLRRGLPGAAVGVREGGARRRHGDDPRREARRRGRAAARRRDPRARDGRRADGADHAAARLRHDDGVRLRHPRRARGVRRARALGLGLVLLGVLAGWRHRALPRARGLPGRRGSPRSPTRTPTRAASATTSTRRRSPSGRAA